MKGIPLWQGVRRDRLKIKTNDGGVFMCLAIPGRIIKLLDKQSEIRIAEAAESDMALVNIMGVVNEINIQLIEQPSEGDYILVHAGCAIERINLEYYEFLLSVFQTWLEEC
jgi:hydrogenase assembly chaperone HypC/HupF